MANRRDERAKKGNKHASNTRRRDRKKLRYLANLRDRMNPSSKKWRSKKDEDKATRLYLNNKNRPSSLL